MADKISTSIDRHKGGANARQDSEQSSQLKVEIHRDLLRQSELSERESLVHRRTIVFRALAVCAVVAAVSFVTMLVTFYASLWSIADIPLLSDKATWPVAIFISGTFLSFIAVFTTLAIGILDPVGGKRDKSRAAGLGEVTGQATDMVDLADKGG